QIQKRPKKYPAEYKPKNEKGNNQRAESSPIRWDVHIAASPLKQAVENNFHQPAPSLLSLPVGREVEGMQPAFGSRALSEIHVHSPSTLTPCKGVKVHGYFNPSAKSRTAKRLPGPEVRP